MKVGGDLFNGDFLTGIPGVLLSAGTGAGSWTGSGMPCLTSSSLVLFLTLREGLFVPVKSPLSSAHLLRSLKLSVSLLSSSRSISFLHSLYLLSF